MRIKLTFRILFLVLGFSLAQEKIIGQLAPYVLYSGHEGPGTTLIGSSITVNGVLPSGFRAAVGGVKLVQTTGNATIKANIYSWDKVSITNSNIIQGDIVAGNSSGTPGAPGTAITIGSSLMLTGNIHSRGDVVVGGGTINGSVNVFPGTYTPPPVPSLGITSNPIIPPQPSMPGETNPSLPAGTLTSCGSNCQTAVPGFSYPAISYSGNKTLTLKEPGVYIFNSFAWTGNSNKLIFDFNNKPGKYLIYVTGNADFGKLNASVINGSGNSNTDAAKIYIEVHGSGSGTTIPNNSFIIANGSSGGGSKWLGSVYASRSGINIGSGTGSSTLTGTFWSLTQVSIQSGVTINYAPFDDCTPIIANAGPDQIGTSTCGLTTVNLAANNPSPGTGQWSIVSGTGGSFGNASSPTSTFSGVSGNTYTLKWTITNSTCTPSSENVVVTFNKLPSSVDADPTNKLKIPLDFTGHANLTGATSSDVTSITWSTTDGVISSALPPPAPPNTANTINITVASGGIYTLTGRNAVGCTKSDEIEVTSRRGGVIGSELKSIYNNYPQSFDPNDPFFTFTLKEGDPTRYVTIDIIFFKKPAEDPLVTRQNIINLLSAIPNYTDNIPDYGLTNILPNGISKFTITGDYPILNLPNLDALDDILNYSRPYYRPFNNGAGSIDDVVDFASEGDITMRSNLVRKGYSQNGIELNGKDVKIGIISDSYRKITDPTGPPDLTTFPESADVIADPPRLPISDNFHISDYAFNLKKTDEGRAMAQIVHRVAKGAELFFSTGVYTAGHFAETILDLAKNKHCKVIVDDITYPTESFLKDGIVATNVNKVVNENKVLYFTAAGNFRNNAYESDYIGTTSAAFPDKGVHNFGGGNIYQKVRLKPGSYMFVLQWVDNFYSNDEIEGTKYDIDFFLSKTNDGKGLIGYNRINTGDLARAGGDPIEFIPITIPALDDYYVIIVNNTPASVGPGPKRLKYIVYKNEIEFRESYPGQYASTISGQGNAEGAITIGAARYYHVPGHPLLEPEYQNITKPKIENGSSFGSSIGGAIVNNESTPRLQPSIVGPDGVTTTVRMGPDYPKVDNYSEFYGTSAAAPHVAAGVALILQGLNKFKGLNIQNIEPAAMKKLMQKTARDMRPDNLIYNFDNPLDPANPPYDFVAGAGLVNIDAAMRTFAAPQPFEIRLIREEGKIPCQDQFTLTIVGENFSANSKVYLVNSTSDPLNLPDDTTNAAKFTPSYISANRDTIKVTITSCVGNPQIFIFTPSTDGLSVIDGGLSNSIRLYDKEIVVQTLPFTRKYAQNNPLPTTSLITATLIDNGVSTPIAESDLGLYGLDNAHLKLVTTATLYSPVNAIDYTITRDFDKNIQEDLNLTNQYRYTFKSNKLTIEKMKLKVSPKDLPDKYLGNYIGNITYDYVFTAEQPANPTELKDALKKYHEVFSTGNALAVIKDFKKPQSGYILSDVDLDKMSMMMTFKSLKNSRKFKIENNKLVPETDPNSLTSQYIIDLASESVYGFKINPKDAHFYEGYPGIQKKALLSKTALENYEGTVHPPAGGTPVNLLNGAVSATLSPLFNGGISSLAPIINGNQLSIIDGKLATINSSGDLVEIPNSPSIQYVNGVTGVGSLCYIINGINGTATLAPLFNGAQITLTNGAPLTLNATNSYVKFQDNDSAGLYVGNMTYINNAISGSLAFILNNQTFTLPDYKQLQESSDKTLMNGAGNTLAPLFNGSFIALNGTSGVGGLATLLNGGGVGGLATLLNGATLAPLFNGGVSTLSSLLNGAGFSTLAGLLNNVNLSFANGATSPTLVSLLNNSGGGGITITDKNAVIIDETDLDPANANFLGALYGVPMITGLGLGQQTIVPSILINPNFDITYALGHVTILNDPNCIFTHAPGKNFGSTTSVATSLWVNLTTKVSGQLNADGKYLLFKGGTFTLNNITYAPTVQGDMFTIPDGMIVARPLAPNQPPKTYYDWAKNMWITEVPINFASTSDLFITGVIVNSTSGFVKKNNNSSTSVAGYFFTNTAGFSDQWTYSMAAYQPTFQLTDIDGDDEVVAMNGTYRAGTPKSIVQSQNWQLVPGGSGGGGNNYTGSTLSFDKFTACGTGAVNSRSSSPSAITMDNSQTDASPSSLLVIYPNPASNRVNISFVPEVTGNSRIILYTMDGKKALEITNGTVEAGKSYLRSIDVDRLTNGIYMVQLWSGDKLAVRKVVINRQ